MVASTLRMEGAAFFLAGLAIYLTTPWPWWAFFVLLLIPDVSMVGYTVSPLFGARMYNLFHNYALPVLLTGGGWWLEHSTVMAAGAIWLAHIGMDRAVGYGLKYPTEFRDTHLGRL